MVFPPHAPDGCAGVTRLRLQAPGVLVSTQIDDIPFRVNSLGGRIARARERGEDPTPLIAELAATRIEKAVRRHLAEAPPLTAEQKARINALLDA